MIGFISIRKIESCFLVGMIVCFVFSGQIVAKSKGHHGMRMGLNGMVMNENKSEIPRGCAGSVVDKSFHVIADSQSKDKVAGTTFSFYPRVFHVEPCTKITVSFENNDDIRHQWMVHGLPRFMYSGGMFHLEANANRTVTGTFIVPFDAKTYLIHCDISQHMQKGMKGMLIVGAGSGKISGVPGETGYFFTGSEGLLSKYSLFFFAIVVLLLLFFLFKKERL